MHIILMGIQGSGKGTQAQNILDNYEYTLFETGSTIREFIAQNPDSDVARTVNAGNLCSDEMIADLTRDVFEKNPGSNFLIDGAIRTIPQKENFDKITREYCVICLNLERDEAIKRLSGRRMDPETNEIFGADFEGDVNPKTGNALIVRDDDTLEGINRRLEEYDAKTNPLIEAFRDDPDIQVHDVDASPSREEVWSSVREVIENIS